MTQFGLPVASMDEIRVKAPLKDPCRQKVCKIVLGNESLDQKMGFAFGNVFLKFSIRVTCHTLFKEHIL